MDPDQTAPVGEASNMGRQNIQLFVICALRVNKMSSVCIRLGFS